MIIQIILAFFIGILAGTITGLIPGIHINLISVILLGSAASLLAIASPLVLVVFIVAMSITHTFLDYIPSIFLGAPDEDTALSILPGHQFLLKGFGYIAIILTLYGSLFALLIIIIFTPIFIFLLPIVYPYILRIMSIILILVSAYLIYNEKQKRFWALFIFILAGLLGISTLNLGLKEPLLPLFTGLFGASSLIMSIKKKIKIPKQKIPLIKTIRPNKKSLIKSGLAAIIASPLTAFLPGLGASQAAVIGSEVTELDQKEFLFLLGAINTIVMGLSFITYYSIQKTRTGAAVAVSKLLPRLTLTDLYIIVPVILLSGIVAAATTIFISRNISKSIHKFDYTKISKFILGILIIITFYFTGFTGLLIFIVSTSLGLTTILLGIRRMHLMGCLLIPTILYYIL